MPTVYHIAFHIHGEAHSLTYYGHHLAFATFDSNVHVTANFTQSDLSSGALGTTQNTTQLVGG